MAGVVVAVAIVPAKPFAVVTDTDPTVPVGVTQIGDPGFELFIVNTWPAVPLANLVLVPLEPPIIKSPVFVIGDNASNAAVFVVAPVPPLPIATVPDTFPAVVAVVAFPESAAVIVPAVKLPLASLFTIVLAVFALVAAFAAIVAVLIFAAVEPPTVATLGEVAVPAKSPANWILPKTKVVADGVTPPRTCAST